MEGFVDFELKFGLDEQGFKVELSVSEAKALFGFEHGEHYPVGILPFGGWVEVVFEVFLLPQVPNSD